MSRTLIATYKRTERGYAVYWTHDASLPERARKRANAYSVGGLPTSYVWGYGPVGWSNGGTRLFGVLRSELDNMSERDRATTMAMVGRRPEYWPSPEVTK